MCLLSLSCFLIFTWSDLFVLVFEHASRCRESVEFYGDDVPLELTFFMLAMFSLVITIRQIVTKCDYDLYFY